MVDLLKATPARSRSPSRIQSVLLREGRGREPFAFAARLAETLSGDALDVTEILMGALSVRFRADYCLRVGSNREQSSFTCGNYLRRTGGQVLKLVEDAESCSANDVQTRFYEVEEGTTRRHSRGVFCF